MTSNSQPCVLIVTLLGSESSVKTLATIYSVYIIQTLYVFCTLHITLFCTLFRGEGRIMAKLMEESVGIVTKSLILSKCSPPLIFSSFCIRFWTWITVRQWWRSVFSIEFSTTLVYNEHDLLRYWL